MSIPSSWASVQDWMRMVALKVNPVLQGYPFMSLDTAPSSPTEGFTYYDTALNKVRTWDGSAWQAHW
jgi:hypothetical protein